MALFYDQMGLLYKLCENFLNGEFLLALIKDSHKCLEEIEATRCLLVKIIKIARAFSFSNILTSNEIFQPCT